MRTDFTVLLTAKTVHSLYSPSAAAVDRPMKRLRVLVLMHPDLMPPDSLKGHSEQDINVWKTEYDVVSTLRGSGHEVRPLGVKNELAPIRDAVESFKPHVVFNLLEEFHGEAVYDHSVVSYLELLRVPYTGCNPRGLVLARGKDLSKKLVHYHRVPTPAFAVFPMGRKVKRPPRLQLPLIVKSLIEDASMGIAQASVVESDEALAERVTFIHERIGTAAIAEQYIEGREIYVGVLGNDRRRVLPIWELQFGDLAQGTRPIATEKVKHDLEYQQRHGVVEGPAKGLPPQVAGPHQQHGQAHLPHARARRLRPHRFPAGGRRHAVFHRGQSQSRDRQDRGIRPVGAARRAEISRPAQPHPGARHQRAKAVGRHGVVASRRDRHSPHGAVMRKRWIARRAARCLLSRHHPRRSRHRRKAATWIFSEPPTSGRWCSSA